MPVSVQIILVISAIAGLAYTVGKALSSVQKEDLAKLEASIDEVKKTQKENADKLETKLEMGISEVKAMQREDAKRLEANRREDTARLENSITAISTKFDTYLFGKLDKTKTDDSPDSRK